MTASTCNISNKNWPLLLKEVNKENLAIMFSSLLLPNYHPAVQHEDSFNYYFYFLIVFS